MVGLASSQVLVVSSMAERRAGQSGMLAGSTVPPGLDFFHEVPPFAGGAIWKWILAGLANGPPFLRDRVTGKAVHVPSKIRSHIFEVAKKVMFIIG